MKSFLAGMAVALAVAGMAGAADAKGCIKGAVVGGVAGHLAHHHGAVGAAAGCAIGHHEASKNFVRRNAVRDNAATSALPAAQPLHETRGFAAYSIKSAAKMNEAAN